MAKKRNARSRNRKSKKKTTFVFITEIKQIVVKIHHAYGEKKMVSHGYRMLSSGNTPKEKGRRLGEGGREGCLR